MNKEMFIENKINFESETRKNNKTINDYNIRSKFSRNIQIKNTILKVIIFSISTFVFLSLSIGILGNIFPFFKISTILGLRTFKLINTLFSFGIGTTSTLVSNLIDSTNEQYDTVFDFETEEDKLYNEYLLEMELEKAKNRNKVIEHSFRQVNRKYINSDTVKEDYKKNKDTINNNYEKLDYLSMKKVLVNKCDSAINKKDSNKYIFKNSFFYGIIVASVFSIPNLFTGIPSLLYTTGNILIPFTISFITGSIYLKSCEKEKKKVYDRFNLEFDNNKINDEDLDIIKNNSDKYINDLVNDISNQLVLLNVQKEYIDNDEFNNKKEDIINHNYNFENKENISEEYDKPKVLTYRR